MNMSYATWVTSHCPQLVRIDLFVDKNKSRPQVCINVFSLQIVTPFCRFNPPFLMWRVQAHIWGTNLQEMSISPFRCEAYVCARVNPSVLLMYACSSHTCCLHLHRRGAAKPRQQQQKRKHKRKSQTDPDIFPVDIQAKPDVLPLSPCPCCSFLIQLPPRSRLPS